MTTDESNVAGRVLRQTARICHRAARDAGGRESAFTPQLLLWFCWRWSRSSTQRLPHSPTRVCTARQAAALSAGSWSVERPATDLDVDGSLSSMIGPSAVDGNLVIPYSDGRRTRCC